MVDRLTPEDARILGLEEGTVRGHTCKLLVVEGTLAPGDLRRLIAGRIATVPRLRRRLLPAPFGLAPPALVDDPDFRLERHVRDGGGVDDDEGLRGQMAELMTEPLDREHPLWAIDVIALGSERTALVWRLHHAIADGTVAMRMARALLFDDGATASPAAGPTEAPGWLDAVRWRGAALAAGTAGAARATISPRNWPRAARATARLPSVLRRELARTAPETPLDRPAGPRREMAFVEAPLERVKAIGHGAPEHATVNDVVLAAVAGGLRRWLGEAGAGRAALRVKVPVSLHTRDEEDGANLDSFMCVDLPLAVAVARETRERKTLHDAQTLAEFFADLSHLSRSLERFAEHWAASPRVFTLNVSNVPGPAEPQRVMGARLLHLYSFAEIAHRHALRIAVVSAVGRIGFGLCADPEAVGGLGRIASGIEEEISELGAAL